MSEPIRTYLDNAATSWPKSDATLQAADAYLRNNGSAAGRGSYRSSTLATEGLRRVRRLLANTFACQSHEIAFVSNGTLALHVCLSGLIRPGEHVITTAIEHNSVLRPLVRRQEKNERDRMTMVPCDAGGFVNPTEIASAVTPASRWIVVSHASNVTGCVQDLDAIQTIAELNGCRIILDAAQTAGYLDVQLNGSVVAIAASGHKGLGGLLGTGVVALAESMHPVFESPWIGGTGSQSSELSGTMAWYEAVESGNVNVPALLGLAAALESQTETTDLEHLTLRLQQIVDASQALRRIASTRQSVPVVSATCDVLDVQSLAGILDSEFGIEVRSGFHCAAAIHEFLGTSQSGGTLRFSLGHRSSDADLDRLAAALVSIDEQLNLTSTTHG
jgi:selenocysteine lyase/cysteine desulfurase